jgi:hypothetical protein
MSAKKRNPNKNSRNPWMRTMSPVQKRKLGLAAAHGFTMNHLPQSLNDNAPLRVTLCLYNLNISSQGSALFIPNYPRSCCDVCQI